MVSNVLYYTLEILVIYESKMQRQLENEPFRGPSVHHIAHSIRCMWVSLLQHKRSNSYTVYS